MRALQNIGEVESHQKAGFFDKEDQRLEEEKLKLLKEMPKIPEKLKR
jgi:hypothetical protein